jgi:hypothetical protein
MIWLHVIDIRSLPRAVLLLSLRQLHVARFHPTKPRRCSLEHLIAAPRGKEAAVLPPVILGMWPAVQASPAQLVWLIGAGL